MKNKTRIIMMGAAALALALGPVLPASAATRTYTGSDGCAVHVWNSTSYDWAKTDASGGYCAVGSIRHYYTVSGWAGWSQWYAGSSTYAETPRLAELSKSEHQFSIHGVAYDITMLG
jgi:hypothetical protein